MYNDKFAPVSVYDENWHIRKDRAVVRILFWTVKETRYYWIWNGKGSDQGRYVEIRISRSQFYYFKDLIMWANAATN